ncbi:hypothetical protein D1BOALGB6SA_957 [Olavius sp. associated proteobacterium Delta 1]|nr:hypothetical protein D1BOALGB6SA_957 [Olavius sp. associated proteobacterium Delta 1]
MSQEASVFGCQRRLWPRGFSLIEKKTLKKRILNNEYRMSK